MSTVDTLRSELNGRTIPLTRFFEDFKAASSDVCYGFVEGKDDPSYYRTIINKFLPQGCSIRLYPSNGKANVKYIYDKLSESNRYPNNRISFFMDRDLSCIVEDSNLIESERVYVTDNYSIENDLLSEDTLENVMQDILGFSSITIDKLNLVKQCFIKERHRFEEMMIPIMSNIVFWKRHNLSPANYKNLQVKDLISFNNCTLSLSYAEEEMIQILYKQSNVSYDEHYNKTIIDVIRSEIVSRDLSKKILRGKYLATFFVEFCKSLCQDHNNMGIDRDKGQNLCIKDIMTIVAPRSKPPYSLECFINNIILSCFSKQDP